MKRVLVDGRVFSTAAYDRGMGRYVAHLLDLLRADGNHVTLLLYRDCNLPPDDPVIAGHAIRFADRRVEENLPDAGERSRKAHQFTAFLSALVEAEGYDVYVDATPFLGPARLDLFGCAVLAVCYDFIPLKHPEYYIGVEASRIDYYNGLARLAKADHVLCISTTTRDEASRYLAVPAERLSVICPTLEERYLATPPGPAAALGGDYLFSILGFHKSKNPVGSWAVYKQLLQAGKLGIRVNVPKHDQLAILLGGAGVPKGIELSASISDDEKFAQQAGAKVIAHLSLEEGFGIPFLEGLFLGRKMLVLDIPINRELMGNARTSHESAVFLLPPNSKTLDVKAFEAFLDAPADAAFYEEIRAGYQTHWRESPALMSQALAHACDSYIAWGEGLEAKIFSSIPGAFCGVADYSMAYVRSASGNVVFFFSEGEQENLSHLPNIRACTHLDFERFNRSRFAHVPGLFNFAFSPALDPGINLLRTSAKPGDVMLIHERRYFDGLRSMQATNDRVDQLFLDIAAAETDEARTRLALDCAFHPLFNSRHQQTSPAAPIKSVWLKSLPVRKVAHLPPEVLRQMQIQEQTNPGSVINDLAAIEDELEFVPLGIDDRHGPAVLRAAQRLRIQRGIQPSDVVVGHFGLILNDLKRLWDVVSAFLAYAKQRQASRDQRRLFFSLVGKVIDAELFHRIRDAFATANLADRLVHSNPIYEHDFDAEIVACNAVICFRVQTRGQLSHAFVRSLSLGTPVLVNQGSGYGYDPQTAVADDDLENGLRTAMDFVFDPPQLEKMRRSARQHYERTHRGDASLRAILDSGTR